MTDAEKPRSRADHARIGRILAGASPPATPAGVAGPPPSGPSPAEATRAAAAALHEAAIVAIKAGDADAARTKLEQTLAIERDLAVPADTAATLAMLGQVLFSQNERERGLALARESRAIFRALDAPEATQVGEIVAQMEALERQDAPGGSRDLLRQGIAALQEGDGETAGEKLDESLKAAVAAGDGAVAAAALHHLGLLLYSAGHLPEAAAALRDSLELNRTLGDESALAAGLALLGQIVLAAGDRAEGLRLLRESVLTWNAARMREQAAQVRALIATIKREGAEPAAP